MNKILNIYVPILLSVAYSIFAYQMLENQYEILVFLSFFGVIFSNLILMILLFRKKYSYFEAMISIFYTLFFIIAPLVQLKSNYYPIPFPIREDYVVLANLCNTIFLLAYLFFRYVKFNRSSTSFTEIHREFNISNITLIIMSIIFFAVFIPNLPNIMAKIIYKAPIISELNQAQTLIVDKFIMFIPLFFVYYYINQFKNVKSKKNLLWIVFWIIILIICKNPFTEKRNALGPIYLSIIFFLAIRRNNPRGFLIGIIPIFVIGLPLTAMITNSKNSLNDLLTNGLNEFGFKNITDQFRQLHFDAFANLNVAIDYTKNIGITWGHQFLGSVLFFVPKLIWENKPLSSGILIGNYLIDSYGFNFNNLSSPITAEGYLNAGILGVIFFSMILSMWSKLVCRWLSYKNYYSLVAWYMVIHLFFLMRGDLMNGIAYLIGPLTAIYFLPIIIERIIKLFKV